MIPESKRRRLDAISTPAGVIAAITMDQRRSLRRMIARAANVAEEAIPDLQLAAFKAAVTEALSPHASAILLDPEYGLDAVACRAADCGLLLTYEADGFENPRPNRMLALLPRLSVARLKLLGADAVKILLSWAPDGDEAANEEKRVLIERIGSECAAQEIPFLLEPVVYSPAGTDSGNAEFIRKKPRMVARTLEEFSKPVYKVDVLKIEFPVLASSIGTYFERAEALNWFRTADQASTVPYVYLSAGVPVTDFVGSLELAAESGARFSGVLCGRAAWQDGVPAFARGGTAAFSEWLSGDGVRNTQRIVDCLRSAIPWHDRDAGGAV
jgi:tagatose 1,6-diphosphate aldolase